MMEKPSPTAAANQGVGPDVPVTPAPKPKPKRRPAKPAGAQPAVQPKPVAPPVVPFQRKSRHRWIILSFLLFVLVPIGVIGTYLYTRAVDQYASSVGFAVRTEETGSAIEILGGISSISGASSSDTDILYEFIQSQQIVEQILTYIDLRRIFAEYYETDPYFSFNPEGSLEDLVSYWERMVKIYYDAGTGLIEVRVRAFDPKDAQDIARAIFDESSAMINQLSSIAREDATRYAEEELEISVERLKQARQNLSTFRGQTQILDPEADIQSQMGLLSNLQQQLAEALIEFDLLAENTRSEDPRAVQATRRIEVIESLIAEERRKFGLNSGTGTDDYVAVIGEFERLSVDREFAEQSYLASLQAFDSAKAEAQRKSRYLAAYINPTLAQTSQFPMRELILALSAMFILMGWGILVLIYYSLRDRR